MIYMKWGMIYIDGIQNPIISSMLYAVCMCVYVSKHLLALNRCQTKMQTLHTTESLGDLGVHVETFRYLITIIIIFIETTPVLQAPRGWRPGNNKRWRGFAKKQVKLELQFN